MQLRQPLHTSCWMKTVSNSVRMIAFVGHTSAQEACWQCLQTSDIISQALPFPVVVRSVRWVSGSMNLTWRQLWASRRPVLSKLSARKAGSLAWSPFHSLQATSQALQPMQMLVSVKKPFACAIDSEPHEIGHDLAEAALFREQVERDRRQLVHQRHRRRVLSQVDGEQIVAAGVAGVHPQMRPLAAVGIDQQADRRNLASRDA